MSKRRLYSTYTQVKLIEDAHRRMCFKFHDQSMDRQRILHMGDMQGVWIPARNIQTPEYFPYWAAPYGWLIMETQLPLTFTPLVYKMCAAVFLLHIFCLLVAFSFFTFQIKRHPSHAKSSQCQVSKHHVTVYKNGSSWLWNTVAVKWIWVKSADNVLHW